MDVVHPGAAGVPKTEVAAQLAKLFKTDAALISTYGFSTTYGGGSSSGFGLIYDDKESYLKFEPKHRLLRAKIGDKKKRSRKQWKDLKKKRRVTWGTGRRAAARAARKAAAA